MKPRIFLFVEPTVAWAPDVVARAIAEDGTVLAGHICEGEDGAKRDLGLTSERSHDKYRAHYPDGYEIVWSPPPTAK